MKIRLRLENRPVWWVGTANALSVVDASADRIEFDHRNCQLCETGIDHITASEHAARRLSLDI